MQMVGTGVRGTVLTVSFHSQHQLLINCFHFNGIIIEEILMAGGRSWKNKALFPYTSPCAMFMQSRSAPVCLSIWKELILMSLVLSVWCREQTAWAWPMEKALESSSEPLTCVFRRASRRRLYGPRLSPGAGPNRVTCCTLLTGLTLVEDQFAAQKKCGKENVAAGHSPSCWLLHRRVRNDAASPHPEGKSGWAQPVSFLSGCTPGSPGSVCARFVWIHFLWIHSMCSATAASNQQPGKKKKKCPVPWVCPGVRWSLFTWVVSESIAQKSQY